MSDGYIDGYKIAADELAMKIHETGVDQDYLVYPIVFLYRQHLELILKSIIKVSKQSLGILDDEQSNSHNLNGLWFKSKELVEKISDQDHSKEIEFIDHIISEYNRYDHHSRAFRYPENRKGKKPNENIKHINTRHLSEMVNRASDVLDAFQLGIKYQ